MVDEKEKVRRESEVLKQEVVKDLDAFRGEFQGITESLAAAKEATQESNAKLGTAGGRPRSLSWSRIGKHDEELS